MKLYVLTLTNEDDDEFYVISVSENVDALKEQAYNSEMYPEDWDWTWDEIPGTVDGVQVRIGDYMLYKIDRVAVV